MSHYLHSVTLALIVANIQFLMLCTSSYSNAVVALLESAIENHRKLHSLDLALIYPIFVAYFGLFWGTPIDSPPPLTRQNRHPGALDEVAGEEDTNSPWRMVYISTNMGISVDLT